MQQSRSGSAASLSLPNSCQELYCGAMLLALGARAMSSLRLDLSSKLRELAAHERSRDGDIHEEAGVAGRHCTGNELNYRGSADFLGGHRGNGSIYHAR